MKYGIVKEKEYMLDYEPGSGSLYIPILGDLFPKLFGPEMNAVDKWFLIVEIEVFINMK